MRASTTWTTKYQMGSIFLAHLEAVGISFVFLAVAFYALMTKSISKEILSIVFIIVHFGIIYSRAHRFATLDIKAYTKTKPDIKKALFAGFIISLSYIVLLIGYNLVWKYGSVDGVLISFPSFVYSLVFYVYTIPYNGIMGLSHGEMMWYSKALMLLVPPLAACLGYFAGLKGFSVAEKLSTFVYEKQDK